MNGIVLLALIASAMAQSWTLFTDAAGETRFRLRAGNNEIVLASEGYTAKNSAVAGIAACKAQALAATNFEIKTATNGEFYFTLKAGNSMVIGTSETYTTMAGATAGVTAVMNAAAAAETIVDQTDSSNSAAQGQFQLFKDVGGEFRFRLLAGNGEPILASEGYTARSSALNGIDSVRKNAQQLSSFELKTATNGQFYFNLKADNSMVIGVSELYKTSGSRAIGQFAVVKIAPDAPLIDLTLGTAPTRKPRFTLLESISGAFRWTLKAANYEIILTSESYTTKQSAMGGIDSVRTNAPMMARFQNLVAADGSFYFTLRAGNNQVIGVSETYTKTTGRDNGIASVMANAPIAELIDNTIDNRYVAKFEVFRDAATGTKWYFRLKAVNGETLVSSASYADKAATLTAISNTKASAPVAARIVKDDAAMSFSVVDSAGKALAFSDKYTSLAARDAGAESTQRAAPDALVIELAWSAPTTLPGATTTPTTPTPTTLAGATTQPDTPPAETTTPTTTLNVDQTFAPTTSTTTLPVVVITVTANKDMTVVTTTTGDSYRQDETSTDTTKDAGAASLAVTAVSLTLLALAVL